MIRHAPGRRSLTVAIAILMSGSSVPVPANTPADVTDVLPDPAPPAFAPGRAGFMVRFRDVTVPYRVFLMRAVPGETVTVDAVATSEDRYSVRAAGGVARMIGPARFEWQAPDSPGVYPVVVRREASPDSIILNAVVMAPFDDLKGGEVAGYRIGDYPARPYRDLPQYLPPMGFLALTPDNADTRVSPHFTLGQFPCKAPGGYPKYVVLTEKLLLKLELILEEANRRGVSANTFQVLSAFRSPWYNAGIGRPLYSRHIYGDAADIYVDDDRNGQMDDLNGDGKIDIRDADVLYRIVEDMDGDSVTAHLIGGLGKYPATPNHGPFIHVDTREYRARW